MTRLKNILSLAGLVVGVPVIVPHQLNWSGRKVLPDVASLDQAGFTVTADATNVTVTRTTGPAAVNILVESWHSIERAFGAKQTLVLSPQPIILQGGGSSSGSSTAQVFRYTAQIGDGVNIVIGAAQGFNARLNTNYNVQVTQGDAAAFLQYATPPSLYQLAQFTLQLNAPPTPGDVFLFTVQDLT